MTQLNFQLPILNQPNSSEDPKVHDALQEIQTVVNGELDTDNLTSALLALLGVNGATAPRRGKSIIATQEAITSTTYALAPTPDRVTGVVVPTDGLLMVVARLKASAPSGGQTIKTGLFLNTTQVRGDGNGGPVEASTGTVSRFITVSNALNVSAFNPDVTTGQLAGIALPVFVAAGTYDVSLRHLVSAGTDGYVAERKLWVWQVGF